MIKLLVVEWLFRVKRPGPDNEQRENGTFFDMPEAGVAKHYFIAILLGLTLQHRKWRSGPVAASRFVTAHEPD
jgi:hypothetical protein